MKQIKLDNETKTALISKFTEFLNNNKFTEDKLTFTNDISLTTENTVRPTIYISGTACLKMMLYIRDTDTEIAWHGTVEKDEERCAYIIKDVFLYPQKLSSATVETDQEKYNAWLENIPDEQFNNMRFQGHSHVNFPANPSGVDLKYYEDILQTLPPDDYYIFMIMNKSGDSTFLIYDLAKNLIYENRDIDVQVYTEDTVDLIKDISDSKKENCEKPTITNYGMYQSFQNKTVYTPLKDSKTQDYDDFEDINSYLDYIDKKYPNNKKGKKKHGLN